MDIKIVEIEAHGDAVGDESLTTYDMLADAEDVAGQVDLLEELGEIDAKEARKLRRLAGKIQKHADKYTDVGEKSKQAGANHIESLITLGRIAQDGCDGPVTKKKGLRNRREVLACGSTNTSFNPGVKKYR